MHDLLGPFWYGPSPSGSALVSAGWHWNKVLQDKMEARGTGIRRNEPGFQAIVSSLQLLDFENVRQELYRLPWATVAGKPETEACAKYAPACMSGLFVGDVGRYMREDGDGEEAIEAMERSCRETIGVPREGVFYPFAVVRGRKQLA